jgi:hypothetical protein
VAIGIGNFRLGRAVLTKMMRIVERRHLKMSHGRNDENPLAPCLPSLPIVAIGIGNFRLGAPVLTRKILLVARRRHPKFPHGRNDENP